MDFLSSSPLGIDLHLLAGSFLDAINLTEASSSSSARPTLVSLAVRPHHSDEASPRARPLLCYDREGWGPYSPVRETDLTPCFEGGVLAAPAAILVLVGGLVIVLLANRQRRSRGAQSERLLWWKLTLLSLLSAIAAANFALTIFSVRSHHVPLVSLDPLSSLVLLLASLVSLPLTFYVHTRTRRASDLLLAFWTITLVLAIPSLRTRYLVGVLSTPRRKLDVGAWATFLAWVIVGAAAFALECLGPEWTGFGRDQGRIRLDEEEEDVDPKSEKVPSAKENPALTANLFSIITFSWLTPLMKLGASRFIDEDDIFDLEPTDLADVLGDRLARNWAISRKRAHAKPAAKDKPAHPSLAVALCRSYGGPYLLGSVFKLCNDVLSFAQPQLLRLLLKFVASYRTDTPDPAIRGVVIALTMFVAALLQTAAVHTYFQLSFTTGMRVKAGIITLLYQKALVLSNSEKAGRTTGDIVNLQSVDALRIADLCQYGQMLWSGPVQITLAFVSLYNLLGWPAFCGVAVMIVSLPLNAAIAKYQKTLQERQMKIKDKRTRLMNEILSNIKSIKLYAWEKSFSEKVLEVRNSLELVMIRRIGVVNSISNFFWATNPFMVAFATFAAYAYTSKVPLTSDIIFPAISLFTLLQFPLAMFSMIISSFIEAVVSEKRLVSFLDAEELQTDARTVIERPADGHEPRTGDELITVSKGSFKWNAEIQDKTLNDINLSIKKGELVGVLGRVGDGKTSLLSALLGEMTRTEGKVVIRGKVAYYSQQSWILSATVKENIVFGHAYDHDFYTRILDACALAPDLAMLAQGDMTEVGEKGVSLSGGQKARIALARAVYARADIYLLDDPLCAVDNHVASHLFANVLGPNGLLKGKARVLCTNSVAFLSQTDNLIMLRGGEIVEQSHYDEVMEARDSPLFSLINGLGKQTDSGPGTPGNGSDGTAVDDTPLDIEKLGQAEDSKRRHSISSLRNAPVLSTEQSKANVIKELRESSRPKEVSQQGQVKTHVYRSYVAAASTIGIIIFLIATFGSQAASITGNLVLRAWGEQNLESHKTASIGFFLFLYGASGLAASLLDMTSSLMLWAFCAVRSSKKLHDESFSALMRSPLSFFEATPQGRILNLFSRDIYVIDEVIVRTFSHFFGCLAAVGGVVAIIGFGVPIVLIGVIPLGMAYRTIMRYYLATSRELKRLDATSRAPIFSWFGETLAGLSVIRAYAQQDRFTANNEARLDRNNGCFLPSVSVNRWLAVRLEFLGSLVMLSAALVSVFTLVTTSDVDAGLVGLLMSYAVSVTGALNWCVRSASEVETNIVSVERVLGFADLKPEAADDIPEKKPLESWPQHGAVEFKDYSTRYREDLEPCVKGISLKIEPGEKIGICGRTGAGKSSLTLALFRIIEAMGGSIVIDGVDISTIGLHDLRSKISIIPQDPQLFEGTLRENVDPIGAYTDDLIWEALEHAHLKPYVEKMDGKLDGAVSEGGQNLSSGQRQLICFARALLRKSRILVLDEATSAIDLETDAAVQSILRGPDFATTTTLTIAHRLDTIMHSTRVLVMDAGKVAEFDTPEALLTRKESIFYSLASQAGLVGADVAE